MTYPSGSNADGGHGAFPAHLHAGFDKFCLLHDRGGHIDMKGRTIVQRLRSIACVHRGTLEEEPGINLCTRNHYILL